MRYIIFFVLLVLAYSTALSSPQLRNELSFNEEKVNFTVIDTLPPQGDIKGGQQVIVEGTGFYDTDTVKCNFIRKKDYIVNGTFISSTKIQCFAPPVNETGNYYIEISLDGVTFSNYQVVFMYVDSTQQYDHTGVIMGVVVLAVLFSLTATAVGVYFWRKRRVAKKEEILYGDQSFSLLPGMMHDPRRNEL